MHKRTAKCKLLLNLIYNFLYSAPLSPVVSKASAGAMETMNIYEVLDMPEFLQVNIYYVGFQIVSIYSP